MNQPNPPAGQPPLPDDLYALDDVDRRIIAMLRANGRATNQQIARSLKIAATTVSARIRRLEQTKAMRVVAVSDFAALGYKVLLAVGIEVQGRSAQDVVQELLASIQEGMSWKRVSALEALHVKHIGEGIHVEYGIANLPMIT